MRVNTSFCVLSSLFGSSAALPFLHFRDVPVKELLPRATYSVVLVDGGSQPEETVIQTIVQTIPPSTRTVLATSSVTLPPVTQHVLETTTIDPPKETKTSVVTITPSPKISIATSYSVIEVGHTSTEVEVILTTISSKVIASKTSTSTHIEAITTSPASQPTAVENTETSSADSFTSTPVVTSTQASVVSTTTLTKIEPTPQVTIQTTTEASSYTTYIPFHTEESSAQITTSTILTTSTKTYDDGMWKTYYPAWNDTKTAGMWKRAPAATQVVRLDDTTHAAHEAVSVSRSITGRLLTFVGEFLR